MDVLVAMPTSPSIPTPHSVCYVISVTVSTARLPMSAPPVLVIFPPMPMPIMPMAHVHAMHPSSRLITPALAPQASFTSIVRVTAP